MTLWKRNKINTFFYIMSTFS